jgi:transcriptional regulator with XRE-family HTH domain
MNWHEIGNRIHTRRKELKLTLAALGESVGRKKSDRKKVSHVTIRNWELGAEIKKDNFDALAKALSVSSTWLETGRDQPGLVNEPAPEALNPLQAQFDSASPAVQRIILDLLEADISSSIDQNITTSLHTLLKAAKKQGVRGIDLEVGKGDLYD